jgi:MOSC domain-containing protein YiiM
MQLMSVNIGEKRMQPRGSGLEITGIYKRPIQAPVEIKTLGIPQDVICDTKHHGGPDQAIYIYGTADYNWWSEELGKELEPGTFGENLTIRGLESAQFNIGDRLHVGAAILEVTAPRIPCGTFARRMGNPQWAKMFRGAERPGLYCRVIREGYVQAGEVIRIEGYTGETISIRQMFRDYYDSRKSEETLRRHLSAPIAIRARIETELALQKLLAKD